jgi:hypothetical protein
MSLRGTKPKGLSNIRMSKDDLPWIRHDTKLETRYAHWGTNLWG